MSRRRVMSPAERLFAAQPSLPARGKPSPRGAWLPAHVSAGLLIWVALAWALSEAGLM